MVQKAFEIGNSVALTIPKVAGIKPGSKVEFSQEGSKLIYRLLEHKFPSLEMRRIEETSGAINLDINPNFLSKIIKNLKENPYDREARLS